MFMSGFSRTWWGRKFIDALEQIMDSGRLGRGRSYARNGRVLDFHLSKGKITAKVRGKINPYFGVYKEPRYKTTIEIKLISGKNWTKVIKRISSKAGFVSKLLVNEMPDRIEDAFSELNLHLLPHSRTDLITDCSCPDWANPCKHIAGVYYLVAAEFDRDPFLMFKLRGLEQKALQKELAKSSLGQILLSEFIEKEIPIENSESYYTRPRTEKVDSIDFKEFWMGGKRLPPHPEPVSETTISAPLIKKQGDYPPFWDKDVSFIEVMEAFYQRIRSKNRKNL